MDSLDKKCQKLLVGGKKYRRREWSPKKGYHWVWYEYRTKDVFGYDRHMLYRPKSENVGEWIDLAANDSLLLIGCHKVRF